jgi:hypothetical protein
MDWLQLLVNLVVTGILLYVIQRVFDERSAKRLEKFKTELQSIAFEKDTKFSKLHEMRVQAIAGLQSQLNNLLSELFKTKYGLESEDSISFKEAMKQFLDIKQIIKDSRSFLDDNKLYLPESLYEKLYNFYAQSLMTEIGFTISRLSNDIASKTEEDKETYIEDHKKELLKASSELAEKILPLMKEIEIEFRKLLGS